MPNTSAEQTATRDITFEIGGFAGNPTIIALREQKPQIFEQIQAYYDATVAPDDPGTISHTERAVIAQHVAAGIPNAVLAGWYQHLVDAGNEPVDETTTRFQAILARIALVHTHPDASTAEDVQALSDAGLNATDIISLSQIIAFVHYQARLHAGLQALGAIS